MGGYDYLIKPLPEAEGGVHGHPGRRPFNRMYRMSLEGPETAIIQEALNILARTTRHRAPLGPVAVFEQP